MKIKDECKEAADQVEYGSEWHDFENHEYIHIIKRKFEPLNEFDRHFGITAQRHGNTK